QSNSRLSLTRAASVMFTWTAGSPFSCFSRPDLFTDSLSRACRYSLETEFLSSARCMAMFGFVTLRLGTFRVAWFRASTILEAHMHETKSYHLSGIMKDEALRAEADRLLASGLRQLLSEYGETHIIGSYALHLMVWRDLDIVLEMPRIDRKAFFELGKRMSDLLQP